MNFRPNFNKYFSEQWSYDSGAGVGLKLTGFPTDITKFIELLHGESCNPIATRRILKELKDKNVKYTTLMSHLDFNYIGDQLKKIGVKMEIVPPISADKLQNLELDNLTFDLFKNKKKIDLTHLGENDKNEIKNRLDIFTKSVEEHYCDFGPYDDDPLVYRPALENVRQKKSRYE